ncbi:MAG: hypothetical protein IKE66_12225 [Hyphomicrobium sp.]|nr:hypothetical protein [Hyphomicrobium sp.]
MLIRRILLAAAQIFGLIKALAGRAKTYRDRFESLVGAHRLIISDVFGADTFVSSERAPEASRQDLRWHDGLDFGPESATSRLGSNDTDGSPVPAFLTRPRLEPDTDKAVAASHVLRRFLPTLLCAGILILAWISTGRSGPFSQSAPSAADAIAEQFSGSGAAPEKVSHGTLDADKRLQFALRFADLYAELLSKDGVCIDGGPFADMRDASSSAASIVIRNLPPGTTLSAGAQMSATEWRLQPDEINALIVKVPPGHAGPIAANIETLNASGGIIGQMAVDVRSTAKDPVLGAARERKKVYRPAGAKIAAVKRSKNDVGAQQAAAMPSSASGATTEPENPAKQQFSFQLPFLPGPYSKTPPPGTTVGQQIMINLGVGPDVLMTAITQKN